MKIVYRITEQDYMDALDLFVANEPSYRRISRRLMPWIGGLLIALPAASLLLTSDHNPALSAIIILMGFYFLYCGFALRRYFRKSYRKDKRYQHEFTAEISEEGVSVGSEDGQSQTRWGGFIRFLESDSIFMLFHATWVFNVFPKRAFTAQEATEFRDLARQNVATGSVR